MPFLERLVSLEAPKLISKEVRDFQEVKRQFDSLIRSLIRLQQAHADGINQLYAPAPLRYTNPSGTVLDANAQTIYFDTTAASTASLPDSADGRELLLFMRSSSGNLVVTPDNLFGGTTITFTTTGQFSLLRFLDGQWYVIAGVAAA